MSEITLFDLPSNGRCACWSMNPWKTRLFLNYKSIPYKTVWVEYPDIAQTLQPHLPPNPPGSAAYTIPTVILPGANPTYITESRAIASALESLHPLPSLHLDSPLLPLVVGALSRIQGSLLPVWMPLVPALLNPVSAEYFHRTREVRFGMTLKEVQETRGGEQAWEAAVPGVREMWELLRRNEGPFVEGETVSYADFVIVGFLKFLSRVDVSSLERLMDMDPAFMRLFVACEKWMERDDH